MKCKPPCETISGAIETNALQRDAKNYKYMIVESSTPKDEVAELRTLVTNQGSA